MATIPDLGWVPPSQRTQTQNDAHTVAHGAIRHFTLPVPQLAKGDKLRLFDFWKDPEVVADVGFVFERIHQITGSCVWAGGTNALFSSIAAQRKSNNPTKAFLPFTLHNYAMSRHAYGEDGQGEGSLGSTFAKSLEVDGVRDWPNGIEPDGLPDYTSPDGIVIGKQAEFEWSSYRNPKLRKILEQAKPHLLGSATPANSVQDVKALVLNGYGVSFACLNFIGNASIRGSGENARLMGKWDTYGPHQQSIHAVEEHPDFGPIYWAQNTWPGSVYPRDPAGGPECGCWVAEDDVARAMRLEGEVYGLSRLNWFPAQPELLDRTP